MNSNDIKKEYKAQRIKNKEEYRQQKKEKKDSLRNFKKEYKTEKTKLRDDFFDRYTQSLKEEGKAYPQNPPKRALLEEIGNATTHGLGSLFAVVAFVLMMIKADSGLERFSAVMYFLGLFIMFTNSCLYHSFKHGMAVKRIFRRFDYSSIYLLIGATFVPILLCYVGGTFGKVFFIVQWIVIIFGITLVGVYGPSKLRFIHIPLYLILGWCGLMFLPRLWSQSPAFVGYILGGGIIYSIGVIPFAIKVKVSHFIWHFFVLAGAIVQWVGVYLYIYLP